MPSFDGIIKVMLGIVGLAIVAVIVGKSAKTVDLVKVGGTAFSDVIKAAVSPVI